MEQPPQKIIPARSYRTAAGSGPGYEWLKTVNIEDRRIIGMDARETKVST